MTSPSTPTVFIVDDEPVTLRFFETVLQHEGFACEQFHSAREFLEQYAPHRPGCLLLDIQMPGMTGLELQEELNRRGAVIPVIFATGSNAIPVAVDAMLHGAFDYLQKPVAAAALLDRVRRALERDAALRASLGELSQVEKSFGKLTERERKVLSLVMDGLSNKQAADHRTTPSKPAQEDRSAQYRASDSNGDGAADSSQGCLLMAEL